MAPGPPGERRTLKKMGRASGWQLIPSSQPALALPLEAPLLTSLQALLSPSQLGAVTAAEPSGKCCEWQSCSEPQTSFGGGRLGGRIQP